MANSVFPPMPAEATTPPDRLVVHAHPTKWREPATAGWLAAVAGSLGTLLMCVAGWWWFIGPLGRQDRPLRTGEGLPSLGFATADVLLQLGPVAVLFLLAWLLLTDVRRLRQFRMVIDRRGLALGDRPDGVIPWQHLRNVVVSAGNRGWRRLLVDDGSIPVRWWRRSRINPGRAQVRQLTSRQAFLVNVAIDRLDIPAEDILRAIHHYSGGRFPDRPLVPPGTAR